MNVDDTNDAVAATAVSHGTLWCSGNVVAGVVVAVWLGVLIRYCRAPIALSPDSMNN